MTYLRQNVSLSTSQQTKLNKAIKSTVAPTLRITPENISATESDPTILLTKSKVEKIDKAVTLGKAALITLNKTELSKIKSGGFLGALLGGLAASVLPGLLGIGKGITFGNGITSERKCSMCNGSGVFLGKPAPPLKLSGRGLYLRTQLKMYMSQRGKVYDISDVKMGEVIGTVIACFLPKVLPILKGLGKSLLCGLTVGAASKGASQAVKAIAGKKKVEDYF